MNNSNLKIIKHLPYKKVVAICVCGNIKVFDSRNVKSGSTKSCGCKRGESIAESNIRRRLKDGEAAFNRLLSRYKRDAKRRDISFLLSDEEFKMLTLDICNYCGQPPFSIAKPSNSNSSPYIYNGIDRIDSNSPYIFYNCVTCCKTCNKMKLALSLDVFLDHIKKIYEYQTS